MWMKRLAVLILTVLAAWSAAPTALADHGCDSSSQSASGSSPGGPGPSHGGDDHACPSPAPIVTSVSAPARAPAANVPRAAGADQATASQLQAPAPAAAPAPDFRPQTVQARSEPVQPLPAGEFPPVRPALRQRDTGPDWAALTVVIGLALLALTGAGLWARRRIGRNLDARWPNG